MVGAAAGQNINDVIALQRTQRAQNEDGKMSAAQKRQRNPEKLADLSGTVNAGGLVEIFRNVEHAGIVEQHGIARPLPDVDEDQAAKRQRRIRQPGSRQSGQADAAQKGIEHSVVGFKKAGKNMADNGGRDHYGQVDQNAVQGRTPDPVDEKRSEDHRQQRLNDDGAEAENGKIFQNLEKNGIPQGGGVVFQADGLARQADTVPVIAAENEVVDDGVNDKGGEQQKNRHDEPIVSQFSSPGSGRFC